MKGWLKVRAGLERNLASPGWAKLLAQSLEKFEAETYGTPEKQVLAWHAQIEMLEAAHVFDFDDDTARLLSLTDNEPHEVKLPFGLTFLDTTYDITVGDKWEKIVGVLLTESPVHVPLGPGVDAKLVPLPGLIAAYVYFDVPEARSVIELPVAIGADIRDAFKRTTGRDLGQSRWSRAEYRATSNVVYNFLDLLESPDAYIVHVARGAKNVARRAREGKPLLPPSDKVVVRPAIRRYIQALKEGGQFHYGHRFWVRGHWRHYRAERYREARGTKDWILPYTKGEGLLIKKRYEVR